MTASGWHRKNTNTAAVKARKAKYDSPEHRAARKHYRSLLDRGVILACWRCGKRIVPGRWHVGHDDIQTSLIRGPECASCNLSAAGRKGALIGNAKRKQARALPFVRRAR